MAATRDQMRRVSELLRALEQLAKNEAVEISGEVYVDGRQVGYVPQPDSGEYAVRWHDE